jgi:predicted O-methyltransferase YrrM
VKIRQNWQKEVRMSNIVDKPEHYFKQFIPKRNELLVELEAEAEREDIPITGPLVGELLYILASAAKSRRILELGTAIGYSAIYLAKACEMFNGRVITFEIDKAMAAKAQQNFQKAGIANRIEIQLKDALETLPQMKREFDFIFMDIEKQDYIRVLPDCERLLVKGGLLVADNVGFKDADAFNRAISDNPAWRSIALFSFLPLHSPENDALGLALRQ